MKRENLRRSPGEYSWLFAFVLVILVSFLACVGLFFHTEGLRFISFIYFSRRLLPTLLVLFTLLGCAGLGWVILHFCRIGFSNLSDTLLFSAGLGIGFFSLIILLAGMFSTGWPVSLALIIMLSIFAIICLCNLLSRLASDRSGPEIKVSLFTAFIVALIAIAIFMNWVSAFLPPLDYDVVEYHLAAPKRYIETGRISFLPGNVYSNFPFLMEMLFIFPMRGLTRVSGEMQPAEFWSASYYANIVGLLMGVLAMLLLWRMGNKFFGKPVGAIAACLFYITPGISEVSIKAYVENGWIFFTLLSLFAFLSFAAGEREKKWLILAGSSAGFAAGCKYPALLLLWVPLLFFLIIEGRLKTTLGHSLKQCSLFILVAVLLFSPWLIKNSVMTGNPTYPLLYKVFGGKDWNEQKNARWQRAHSPGSRDIKAMAERFYAFFVKSPKVSLPLFVFVPLALLWRKRKGTLIWLFAFFAAHSLLWLLFTHRIDRFMLPATPALAVISAVGVCSAGSGLKNSILRGTLLLLLLLTLFQIALSLPLTEAASSDVSRPQEGLRKYLPFYPAIEFLEGLPADEKVLSVGEARSFYFRPNVITRTVFDECPLPDLPPENVKRYLKENGIRYLLVNWNEIARFQRTYAFEFEGRMHGGFSDYISPDYFQRLVEEKVLKRLKRFEEDVEGGKYLVEIYRVEGSN